MTGQKMPIGVFTSAGAGLGAAIEKVTGLGVSTVQLHAPGPDGRGEQQAGEIARRFSLSPQTVINWRARYESGGVAGLFDEDRSGRPRTGSISATSSVFTATR